MTLWFTCNAIAFIQTSIEPLRAVGHAHLIEDRINKFFIKHLCIFWGSEVSILFAPGAPAIGQPVCHLLRGSLPPCCTVGLRNTGLTEILLRKYVCSNLAPLFRNLHIFHFKYDFA